MLQGSELFSTLPRPLRGILCIIYIHDFLPRNVTGANSLPSSQRPYDVSRGQNRYVTLPLGEMTMACVPKAESGTNWPKMTTLQYRCFCTSLTPQSTTLLNFFKRPECSKDLHTFQKECDAISTPFSRRLRSRVVFSKSI